ncbi:hypothetical protein FALBO_5850 [Fusarium albosuccineum]|uniref:Uncharacterized protein n=1 Tax=Fusarium albosuccineum TaxID=1237068 RepID=A0A8H4LEH2_9HYPO|nr:hypothetical protein FALBO_5850 [Fusarium albosuccineum]
MERGHEQPRAGQQSTQDVTSSALQGQAENTGGKLTLAETSPRFYEDEPVFCRAQQWSRNPHEFFRYAPQGCIACQLYRIIKTLSSEKRKPYRPNGRNPPEERALISTIELRIYAIFFHLLRTRFHELFHSEGGTDPLASYLSAHGVGKQAKLSADFTKFNTRGDRYHRLAISTGHYGVLLLSTTFSIELLEKTGDFEHVSAAAIKEVPGIRAMETFDDAANKIFGVFEISLANWIGSMSQSSDSRVVIQHLIDLQKESSSDQNPQCPSPFDIQLVTVPETSAALETSAAPENFLAFPQMATVADTSGVVIQVCVGALAEGLKIPVLAAEQRNYPPSSEVANEYLYSATGWPNLIGLDPLGT